MTGLCMLTIFVGSIQIAGPTTASYIISITVLNTKQFRTIEKQLRFVIFTLEEIYSIQTQSIIAG